jgi:hypothetical protein
MFVIAWNLYARPYDNPFMKDSVKESQDVI